MQTLRVMIVEKDSKIAGLWAELMTAFGHEVCAIESAESHAYIAARREKPDLMIVNGCLRPLKSAMHEFEVDLVGAMQQATDALDQRAENIGSGASRPAFAPRWLM